MGLIGSGKTVALYQLKLGEPIESLPTIDFVGESFAYKKYVVTIWEIGGNVAHMLLTDPSSNLWQHYFQTADGVIWMVDSVPKHVCGTQQALQSHQQNQQQHHALRESRRSLHELDARLKEMSYTMPLGVLANKQDHPAALSARHVAGSLAVEMLHSFSPIYVQSSSGQTSASQLQILMDWICTQAKLRQQQQEKKS